MTKQIKLIFGCHSHQPVGNFDNIFEESFHKAYLPFIETLEKYPAVRVTLHYTGPLLDWFRDHRPEFLVRLGAMARSGQIEIMGGAFYEPMLCAIPERDGLAQIQRMMSFCEKHFGKPPRGMWLAERVWEPHLPRLLKQAGVEYTALDDTHFLCSGLTPNDLFGYYMTEDEGYSIKVFPILSPLRYTIPFQQVHKTIDFLREHATEDGSRCAVVHDDGEKFGVWPETYHSVYEEGWLEEFFQALTDNRDWLHSVTYSDYLDNSRALGRTYLTCASYFEMMEWALPTPMQRRLQTVLKQIDENPERAAEHRLFTRGSFWRSFMAKYPEANGLQKRMLHVSRKLQQLQQKKGLKGRPELEDAEKLLHEGQCNCSYWHGVFGGLYLNHLRTAVYEKLIAADRVLDGLAHKTDRWVEVETLDFDGDGNDEAVLANPATWIGLSPTDGGTWFEWDFKPKPFNFGNTLSRRDELYHDALRQGRAHVGPIGDGESHSIHDLVRAKEAGLDSYLVYDSYRRVSLRDHFFPEDLTVDELWSASHRELGDFATAPYGLEIGKSSVILTHRGHVRVPEVLNVSLRKEVSLPEGDSVVEIRYDIVNESEYPLRAVFGVEFCVNLLSGSSFDRYYRSDDRDMNYCKLGERGCDNDLSHLALRDDWQRIECGFRFDTPAQVYRFAVETVSQSEGGQERVYQGSVVIPCWRLNLEPGQRVTRTIRAEAAQTAGTT
ncbi:MAG: DUF1926 domain-containing protein [Candidatus Hydrogenedentes bacterium]|nr:DUF1926 domain-containing protein [Candidatus Hydrogenedentota bacterium]